MKIVFHDIYSLAIYTVKMEKLFCNLPTELKKMAVGGNRRNVVTRGGFLLFIFMRPLPYFLFCPCNVLDK